MSDQQWGPPQDPENPPPQQQPPQQGYPSYPPQQQPGNPQENYPQQSYQGYPPPAQPYGAGDPTGKPPIPPPCRWRSSSCTRARC